MTGPGTPVPGSRYRVGVPCRLVRSSKYVYLDSATLLVNAYLTTTDPPPTGPLFAASPQHILIFDLQQADRVALSGGPPVWLVWGWDRWMMTAPGPYRRVWLIALPGP